MAKVTMREPGTDSPSAQIIREAKKAVTVRDAQGREISIKRLLPLDRMKMFEIIGAANSSNEQYIGYAAIAFCVTAIDGDPVMRPRSKAEIEAIIQRLDDDGINAVSEGAREHFIDESADIETLKNGLGTPS